MDRLFFLQRVAPGSNKSIMSYNRMLTKRVLITTGRNGIGRAICRLFGSVGTEVAIIDINNDAAERTLALLQTESQSKHHCVITGDVRKVDVIKRTFDTAFESFGRKPNILINNAAVLRYSGSIDVVSEDNMNDVIDINLKGVYMMAKYFIAQVKGSGDIIPATIVNIASMAGKVGMAMDSDYAASKAGVIGLTKSIALEYRWHKVRCNALLPGFTDTSMAANSDGHILHKIINHAIPMRRLAEPEEIANACLFLAGEESSYVNGACLEVAGGL